MFKNKQSMWESLDRLPVESEWCQYKDETVFVSFNPEASLKAGKPMIDLHYCATAALNNLKFKTVQYDKNKFDTRPLIQRI